jgi:hypothetical protein
MTKLVAVKDAGKLVNNDVRKKKTVPHTVFLY